MTNALGPRPSNPAEISFAARCFAVDGVSVHWTVTRSALHSGPARFDDEAQANAYARKVGKVAQRHESPRLVRIAWK